MKTLNKKMPMLMLILTLSLSLASAVPIDQNAQSPALMDEAATVGGRSCCMEAWGLGFALALGTLSPCGVICATAAWYDLIAIGACCE